MKKFIPVFLLCGCAYIQEYTYTPDYTETASYMIGLNERSNRKELTNLMGVDPVRYEWCAAFVNAILNLHDIQGSESVSENPLMARSFLKWGTEVLYPEKGDIVVFSRGTQGWQGHVGFYIETTYVNGIEYYIILGGNQDNSITYDLYPTHRVLGIRRYE